MSDFLNQTEAAEYLGVHPESLRLWRRDGKFPAPSPDAPGRRPHWTRDALDAFAAARKAGKAYAASAAASRVETPTHGFDLERAVLLAAEYRPH